MSHPLISINPSQGDPPEEYSISYRIGGMSQTEEGEVHETFGHTISLTIPFGYPHFPPSCKPNTNIFHPDFDPAAICITSFWEQEQSLPELIINVGRMINCEIYSTSNFFNEEAGDWYQKNSAKFPLSEVTWKTAFKPKEKAETDHIDTLDDSDLSTSFSFHEIELSDDTSEEDISISDSFPQIDSPLASADKPFSSSREPDIAEISLLNSQKKYIKLQETTRGTTLATDEVRALSEKSGQAIKKAQELYSQAKVFEDQGKAQLALRLFKQVASTVSDFPAIQADIKRAEQTLALLQDISPDLLESQHMDLDPLPSEMDDSSQQPSSLTQQDQLTPEKGRSRQSETTLFAEKKSPLKAILLTILLLLLLVSAGAGYLWFSSNKSLEAAQHAAASCNSYLQENDFTQSKTACEQGLSSLTNVKFIKQSEVTSLRNSMNKILQSEKLIQGIAGNVMFNGKYISQDSVEEQRLFNTTLETANSAYTEEQWQKALKSYTELLKLLNSSDKLSSPLEEQEVNYRTALCSFRISYDEAMGFMTQKKWEQAIDKFKNSMPLLAHLSPKAQANYEDQLHTHLSLTHFNSLKEKGDNAFAESKWQQASSFYSEALTHLKQKNKILPEAVTLIKNNNKRAQLYKTIMEGNQAFSSANWDRAIAAYDRADAYLRENQDMLSLGDSLASRKKLSQIRLQALVVKDKQIAEEQLSENKLKEARATYQIVVQNIAASAHSHEEIFIQSRKELLRIIEELNGKIDQKTKIAYLVDNFQNLFISNYPASNKENLTKPLVTFIKKEGSKEIFRMQCSETGRGRRPLTLVMFYAFNSQTGRWNLHSEQ